MGFQRSIRRARSPVYRTPSRGPQRSCPRACARVDAGAVLAGDRQVRLPGYLASMPEISRFFGIVVQMFWDDHLPPHFHARYGRDRVQIEIGSWQVLRGSFPPRALALLLEWAVQHRDELMRDWELAEALQPLDPIEPLR